MGDEQPAGRPMVTMRRQVRDTRQVRLLFDVDATADPDLAADRVWELAAAELAKLRARREGER